MATSPTTTIEIAIPIGADWPFTIQVNDSDGNPANLTAWGSVELEAREIRPTVNNIIGTKITEADAQITFTKATGTVSIILLDASNPLSAAKLQDGKDGRFFDFWIADHNGIRRKPYHFVVERPQLGEGVEDANAGATITLDTAGNIATVSLQNINLLSAATLEVTAATLTAAKGLTVAQAATGTVVAVLDGEGTGAPTPLDWRLEIQASGTDDNTLVFAMDDGRYLHRVYSGPVRLSFNPGAIDYTNEEIDRAEAYKVVAAAIASESKQLYLDWSSPNVFDVTNYIIDPGAVGYVSGQTNTFGLLTHTSGSVSLEVFGNGDELTRMTPHADFHSPEADEPYYGFLWASGMTPVKWHPHDFYFNGPGIGANSLPAADTSIEWYMADFAGAPERITFSGAGFAAGLKGLNITLADGLSGPLPLNTRLSSRVSDTVWDVESTLVPTNNIGIGAPAATSYIPVAPDTYFHLDTLATFSSDAVYKFGPNLNIDGWWNGLTAHNAGSFTVSGPLDLWANDSPIANQTQNGESQKVYTEGPMDSIRIDGGLGKFQDGSADPDNTRGNLWYSRQNNEHYLTHALRFGSRASSYRVAFKFYCTSCDNVATEHHIDGVTFDEGCAAAIDSFLKSPNTGEEMTLRVSNTKFLCNNREVDPLLGGQIGQAPEAFLGSNWHYNVISKNNEYRTPSPFQPFGPRLISDGDTVIIRGGFETSDQYGTWLRKAANIRNLTVRHHGWKATSAGVYINAAGLSVNIDGLNISTEPIEEEINEADLKTDYNITGTMYYADDIIARDALSPSSGDGCLIMKPTHAVFRNISGTLTYQGNAAISTADATIMTAYSITGTFYRVAGKWEMEQQSSVDTDGFIFEDARAGAYATEQSNVYKYTSSWAIEGDRKAPTNHLKIAPGLSRVTGVVAVGPLNAINTSNSGSLFFDIDEDDNVYVQGRFDNYQTARAVQRSGAVEGNVSGVIDTYDPVRATSGAEPLNLVFVKHENRNNFVAAATIGIPVWHGGAVNIAGNTNLGSVQFDRALINEDPLDPANYNTNDPNGGAWLADFGSIKLVKTSGTWQLLDSGNVVGLSGAQTLIVDSHIDLLWRKISASPYANWVAPHVLT